MKKTIKKMIVASAMFGMLFSMNVSEAAVLMGDANGDGKVDELDIDTMYDYKNGKNVYINISNADVYEQDGKITSGDIYLLQHYLNYYGDADGNGRINSADIDYIRDILLGKINSNYRFICDLNGDKKINVVDLSIIQEVVDKKENTNAKILGNIKTLASNGNNEFYIVGSCYYNTAPKKAVKVNIYIGGDKGNSNAYHTEVTAKYGNNTNGWFALSLYGFQKIGNQEVNVYGHNEYTGKDEKIYSGKLYINGNFNHSPEGTITSFYSPAVNQVTLTGKVYDRDDMNKDVTLQVYIGNDMGGSDRFTVKPNQTFSHTYTVKNVSGQQAYTVWAIDDYGPNRQDIKIGSGTINIKTPAPSPAPAPTPAPVTNTTYQVTTNGLNLNLRQSPSTNSRIIAKMPNGSVVSGSDQGNGWIKVTYNGMTGYASSQYLKRYISPGPNPIINDDQKQIYNKMANLSRSSGYMVGTKYSGSGQCRGFANKVYQSIFSGVNYISGYSSNNYAATSYSGSYIAGRLYDFSASDTNAVKNLFMGTKVGAFVQMGRRYALNSSKTAPSPHSAIVYSIQSDGVEFYEANTDGKNTIKINKYTWATLADKNKGFTIYLPNNYR